VLYQGVYQPGKPGKVREFQRSGKNREKSGNFVIGQGIFIVGQGIFIVIYGHVALKTPVPVRSPKLSNVERG
jgi:hypothetical protein